MKNRGVSILFICGLAAICTTPAQAGGGVNDGPAGVSGSYTQGSEWQTVPQVDFTSEQRAAARSRLDQLWGMAGPLAQRAAWIIDVFDDGNADGWGGPSPGCSSSIDAPGAEASPGCLRIDGACGHFGGMFFDMSPGTPTGLHLFVKSGSTAINDAYVVFSDAASRGTVGTIFFYAQDNGRFIAASDAAYDCGPYVADVWYSVDFNLDWQCEVYDVSINGELAAFNIPMREYFEQIPDNIQYLDLYNLESSTGWWDQVWVSTPGVSPLIFENDFERGSTCGWSVTSG